MLQRLTAYSLGISLPKCFIGSLATLRWPDYKESQASHQGRSHKQSSSQLVPSYLSHATPGARHRGKKPILAPQGGF
jgi:hypothetical protein